MIEHINKIIQNEKKTFSVLETRRRATVVLELVYTKNGDMTGVTDISWTSLAKTTQTEILALLGASV